MNAPMGQKDRPWRARISFQNGEATATLTPGNSVVLLASNPTKVVLPSTAGGTLSGALFAGVATDAAAPGEWFDVIVAGYAPQLAVGVITRANSTSVWPSFASINPGDYFIPDSTNNMFSKVGAAAVTSPYGYGVVAVGAVVGATTTQASSLGSGTSSIVTVGAWIRALV